MIAGYAVRARCFCGAPQAYLHLRTKEPFYVRCARCGARGPVVHSAECAVKEWNGHVDDVANGGKEAGE